MSVVRRGGSRGSHRFDSGGLGPHALVLLDLETNPFKQVNDTTAIRGWTSSLRGQVRATCSKESTSMRARIDLPRDYGLREGGGRACGCPGPAGKPNLGGGLMEPRQKTKG